MSDPRKPFPPFAPSIGREVQYSLLDRQAQQLNRHLQDFSSAALDLAAEGDDLPPAITYKEGDPLAAKIVHVHEDGHCELMLFAPGGLVLPTHGYNAYGPGGYLYFNQIRNEPKPAPDRTTLNPLREEDVPF